jgi:C-terminal processing protease CtpA/Prc
VGDLPNFENELQSLEAEPLSIDERRQVLKQAEVLIEGLYVHLPLKRAMHAIDPVQRMRLVDRRLEGLSDRAFHDEMIDIFLSLRDLHTNYMLPAPYSKAVAFLPFRIEAYWEGDERHYVVTQWSPTRAVSTPFGVGVEVTHWNGIPIDRAVTLNGELNGGSNREARRAQGLDSLTQRWMAMLAPPDEEWVTVTFRTESGDVHDQRFPWRVWTPPPSATAELPSPDDNPVASALGLNLLREETRRAQKAVLSPEAVELEQAVAAGGDAAPDPSKVSLLPDVLEFGTIQGPGNPVGYLRIRTFATNPEPFVEEVIRILGLLPISGLIVDVRGNGGGVIAAGEMLLQLFTPKRIEPESMCFINTRLTEKVTAVARYAAWRESISEAVELGSPFSDALPLAPEYQELCNSIGQRYYGPVALITDALCYSTTDIFAAGFQDHGIGPVIGTDANTGAGGANVWDYAELHRVLPEEFPGLPKDMAMRVAIRRTTRVGKRAGDPVEDLGIVPDHPYRMTRRDVLEGNPDLIAKACQILSELPIRSLDASLTSNGGGLEVGFTSLGLDRLDAYVDGRPRQSWDVVDGEQVKPLSPDGAGVSEVELRGFAKGELVALRKLAA